MNTPSLLDAMQASYLPSTTNPPYPLPEPSGTQPMVCRAPCVVELLWPSVGFQLGKTAFRAATARSFLRPEKLHNARRMAYRVNAAPKQSCRQTA